MANAARVHAIESGKDIRTRTMVAFGGAAPLHAARVAEKLGIGRVLIPANAGVGSAVGLLRAPVAYEIVRSRLMRLDTFDPRLANSVFADMRAEAEEIVRRGEPRAELTEQRSAFMRYRGQGHEIAVDLPVREFTLDGCAGDHRELVRGSLPHASTAAPIPGVEIEILSWVVIVERAVGGRARRLRPRSSLQQPKPRRAAPVFDPASGAFIDIAVYERADLAPGAQIKGPAVIAEDDTDNCRQSVVRCHDRPLRLY